MTTPTCPECGRDDCHRARRQRMGVGSYDPQIELACALDTVARLRAERDSEHRHCPRCARTDTAYLVGAPHLGGPCGEPTAEDNCPFWYDYCLCTVENFADQIKRANAAEAQLAAVAALADQLRAALKREP